MHAFATNLFRKNVTINYMNRIQPILHQISLREKQLVYENLVLKTQHNEMVIAINILQGEVANLEKKYNDSQKTHATSLTFLQNKNAHLNQIVVKKQKQLNILMQKYDITSNSPIFAVHNLDVMPEFSSDSDTNEYY